MILNHGERDADHLIGLEVPKEARFPRHEQTQPEREKEDSQRDREKRLSTSSLVISMAANCTPVRPLARGLGTPHLCRPPPAPALA